MAIPRLLDLFPVQWCFWMMFFMSFGGCYMLLWLRKSQGKSVTHGDPTPGLGWWSIMIHPQKRAVPIWASASSLSFLRGTWRWAISGDQKGICFGKKTPGVVFVSPRYPLECDWFSASKRNTFGEMFIQGPTNHRWSHIYGIVVSCRDPLGFRSLGGKSEIDQSQEDSAMILWQKKNLTVTCQIPNIIKYPQ